MRRSSAPARADSFCVLGIRLVTAELAATGAGVRLSSAPLVAVGAGAVHPAAVAGRFVHPVIVMPPTTANINATAGQCLSMLAPLVRG
jgi:hypothetical protein